MNFLKKYIFYSYYITKKKDKMTFLQETPLHNNNKSEFIFALSNVFNAME